MSAWAQRTKLNGEILLLDREMTTRKKEFGVELWDLISSLDDKHRNDFIKAPTLFKGIEEKIKVPLEECRKDMMMIDGDRAIKQSELHKLQVRREGTVNGGIGTWMSNSSEETKLKAQIALLDRNAKIRKEQFGMDVWEPISESSSISDKISQETKKGKGTLGSIGGAIGGLGKGIKSTTSSGLGKLSKDEREIQKCVDKVKEDMSYLQRTKDRKIAMIDTLS